MRGLWAESTWHRKRSVWRRYAKYHEQITGEVPTGVDEGTAVRFVVEVAHTTGKQAAKAYGADLIAIQKKLSLSLQNLVRALDREHQGETKQAPTFTDRDIMRVMERLPSETRRAVWWAWKTASRWDDVRGLRFGEDVVQLNSCEALVLFGPTKATRAYPFREDHQVIVRHEGGIPEKWMGNTGEVVTELSTAQLNNQLRKTGVRTAEGEAYTAHSLKRGAMRQLLAGAAEILEFPTWLIPLLAKHKGTQERIPAVTVGYLSNTGDRLNLARVLRTGEATALLDPERARDQRTLR